MHRNLQGIGLLITVLTAFIVVDATSAFAQKKPMTVQITVTEDAAIELENWPQDGIAFTSARTPTIRSATRQKFHLGVCIFWAEIADRHPYLWQR